MIALLCIITLAIYACQPCETYPKESIIGTDIARSNPLIFLALTCHEFSEVQMKKAFEKIDTKLVDEKYRYHRWLDNYNTPEWGDLRNTAPSFQKSTNYITAQHMIQKKKERGCNAEGCKIFSTLLEDLKQKREGEKEREKKEEQIARLKQEAELDKRTAVEYKKIIDDFKNKL